MHASEVMTTDVIATTAETSVRDVARLLLQHGISAVPVLAADGTPIGMVSEGDLVQRDDMARLERRDWWLKLVADDTAPDDAFIAGLRAPDRTARDVMSAPIVTVAEDTDLTHIARLLGEHHIKRVPVVKDGRVVGIVSRANLLRALTDDGGARNVIQPSAPGTAPPHGSQRGKPRGRGFLFSMFGEYHRPAWQVIAPQPDAPAAGPTATPEPEVNATTFRSLVEDFHTGELQHHDAERRAAAKQRHEQAKQLIDTHVSDETWQALLHHARQAAAVGEKESLLLRFPNELCSDGGRAIDVAEERWPATLRGEPAELYLRWERELKQRGFHLAARVMEYPGGMPGDIGLFLVWGGSDG